MGNSVEVFANDGIRTVGVRFNNVKPVIFVAVGFALGMLALNYINNQKMLS